MRLLNPFKAFSSSSKDAQSGGEAEIALQPSLPIGSSRKRRRLKRRATTRPAESQPEHSEHVASTPAHEGFWSVPSLLTEVSPRISSPIPTFGDESPRSTPNFLTDSESSRQADDAQQQTWRSMPAPQRQSASVLDYGHFQENISDGDSWPGDVYSTYSDGAVQPPFDPERTADSPVFGPRMEGLFRNEMPYDMDSPLSRLASGWRDTSPRVSRPLPDPPISVINEEHPHNQSVTYPHDSSHDPTQTNSRELPLEWKHPTMPRIVSPEAHPQQEYRRPQSTGSAHGTYYIVPGGMSVIFQDEAGNEITRVGNSSGRRRRISQTPIIVQDENGHELYRTSDIQNSSTPRRDETSRRHSSTNRREEYGYERSHRHSRSARAHRSHSPDPERSYGQSEPPTIVLIDRNGRQIPIMPYR